MSAQKNTKKGLPKNYKPKFYRRTHFSTRGVKDGATQNAG
jgi:hypothetical protein